LNYLDLRNNNITVIPGGLSELKNLKRLVNFLPQPLPQPQLFSDFIW